MSGQVLPLAQERTVVAVLDLDPELGNELSSEQLAEARMRLVAPVVRATAGRLDFGTWPSSDRSPALGLLVLRGLLARDITLAGRISTELLGPGDLIRPNEEGGVDFLAGGVLWMALTDCRFAVLDDQFLTGACKWPLVVAELCARAMGRSTRLAAQQALSSVPGVELRLTMLLWHLAERWGRVGREGVVVPLQLSHDALGRLVGARRPSVTTAIGQLMRSGVLSRRADGGWLLAARPPEHFRSSQTVVSVWAPPAISLARLDS